ncbi:hypothetical protein N9393_01300 [Luminiphilus sp.]|nr:hypothetical protein [Luminiphilus sp.]MDB3932948.1 hypothetical protein [Luminiphilus sp.]
MTSYECEQDYLRDQIYSNKLAIKYLETKLEMVDVELMPDYLGTDTKVIDALTAGIKSLKDKSKKMRQRVRDLDASDD